MDLNCRPRSGDGRKKTPTQKIESKRRRQVTFTKRRQGLFRKAAAISTICGADVAVIAFSPGGKPYSFATRSSVESILDTFFSTANPSSSTTMPANAAQQQQQEEETVMDEQKTTEDEEDEEEAIGEIGLEELLVLQEKLEERKRTLLATRLTL